MTIHLSKDLEKIVHDAVRAGRYANENDVIRDALMRLDQAMPEAPNLTRKAGKRAKAKPPATAAKTPLTIEQLHQQMLADGLLTQLPNPAQDIDDDDDPPIVIKGEPLSETIIRERR